MRLIMVRHGETIENTQGIIQGHLPGKLTKRGIAQVKKVAEWLRNQKVDVVYSSDLGRAVDTTRIILQNRTDSPVVKYVPELRERNFGVFEGTPKGTIRAYVNENRLDFVTFKPEGGESIEETKQRTIAFYNSVLKQHKNETVLWVTHGGIIVNLLLYLRGWGDERYKEVLPENAEVTIINHNPNAKPTIRRLKIPA